MKEKHLNRAFILVQANVQKKINFPRALRRLHTIGNVLALSSIYETVPPGNRQNETTHSGVVLLETELNAFVLKRALKTIEAQLERVCPIGESMPRQIVLEPILFNQDIVKDEGLHIPCPLIAHQAYLALALAEISPEYVHPIAQRTIGEIARQFGRRPAGVRIAYEATSYARQALEPISEGVVHA